MQMASVVDAARELGVSKRTVVRWCQDGVFPGAFKRGLGKNSPLAIPQGDIDGLKSVLEGRKAGSIGGAVKK